MRRSKWLCAGVLLGLWCTLLFAVGAFAAESSIYTEEDPSLLSHVIYLPTTRGEQAQVRFPDGRAIDMGRVLAVPVKSKHPGFTASKYGIGGQIIATAANAHHIQISVEEGAGRTMSLIPSQTFVAAPGYGTSFTVEGVGGVGLWGRYAPFVGSPVYIVNEAGMRVPFNSFGHFQHAQAVEIHVYNPRTDIEYLEIENWAQGRAWYRDAYGDHDFAVVESGVAGSGRFEGTMYQGLGMVRANHPGVICVSTSHKPEIGGFQIVPLTHTYSKELQKIRNMPQYIVLRGLDFEDLTGKPPFFRGHVRPGDTSVSGSLAGKVICRIDGKWQEIPDTFGRTEDTLEQIEAFRIYLR